MLEVLDADLIEAEACRRSFSRYVRRAWREADPKPLIDGWHLGAVCEHLQAVSEGQIKKLIINIPPGFAKSMIASVLWPTWQWIKRPQWQLMVASYEIGLATRDAVKARDLMRGEWYTRYFRGPGNPFGLKAWSFTGDQDVKSFYKNTRKGHRQSLGVDGKGTGYRGDALLIDDPISAQDAYSKVARENAIRWKTNTMSSRFNDQESAAEVLIMQRLHEQDLSGYLLKEGGWEHLRLPARFEAAERCRTRTWKGADFWQDPRKAEGDLLFPQKFGDEVLKALKVSVGSYGFAGQYQQRPVPAEGGMLKREWFRKRWILPGQTPPDGLDCVIIPPRFEQILCFTDAAFKKTETSDFVACGVFGVSMGNAYMIDLVWKQLDFLGTVAALKYLKGKWAKLSGIYIEAKANGDAIMNTLVNQDGISGVIPFEPEGGKEARIAAASPFIEAGNLILPIGCHWIGDFIDEAIAFPKAAHDDAIDMTCSALAHICGKNEQGLLDALAKW